MIILICLIGGCILSCQNQPSSTESELAEFESFLPKADSLAHAYIITDGHVDLPYRLRVKGFQVEREYLDLGGDTQGGDFDYTRAKSGGLDAPFMSIYLPAGLQKIAGRSKEVADTLIDMVERVVNTHPDKYAIARTPAEVLKHFNEGKIALPMGMENGSPIEKDINNVAHFHKRGVRYITLTHSKVNNICDSSYDTTRTWNGLSPFGEEVVKEMNRIGIMVDVSHISDSAFYDVMAIAKAPVIASHSSCRYFTPGFERNMSDEMINELGKNGGVIQINFGSTFVDSLIRQRGDKMREALKAYLDPQRGRRDSTYLAKQKEWMESNGYMYSDVKVVADHIDHVVTLIGVDHVGFGSDFDGVGDTLPIGLKDVSQYPNLIAELLRRGYSDEDIEKICFKNVFRVWNQVEEFAMELQAGT
ncbi:MAG: dipeptidase [Bacteroidia bacterium]|nr:dipeptidase [Bacteroidia bacterium]